MSTWKIEASGSGDSVAKSVTKQIAAAKKDPNNKADADALLEAIAAFVRLFAKGYEDDEIITVYSAGVFAPSGYTEGGDMNLNIRVEKPVA